MRVDGKILFKIAFFFAVSLATALTFASAADWKQTKDKNGIKVFRRDLPDSRLVSFSGVGMIDAPVDRLLSIIVDTSRTREWTTDKTHSELLWWIKEPIDYVQYDHIVMPWPVKDREFVSRIRININPQTYETRVTYSPSDMHVEDRGRVRGDLNGSYYILQPIDGGRKTLATGVVVADPKGNLPKWIINFYQRNWPYDLIMALRKQSAKRNINLLPRLMPFFIGFQARLEGAPGTPAGRFSWHWYW